MWCLLLRTVGVNHTPWESDVQFHTMAPLACVVWGLREGLEIKGQPVCQVNSREQYFTYSTFSQRMLMSVDFLDIWLGLKGWWLPGVCVFCPCFHFWPIVGCKIRYFWHYFFNNITMWGIHGDLFICVCVYLLGSAVVMTFCILFINQWAMNSKGMFTHLFTQHSRFIWMYMNTDFASMTWRFLLLLCKIKCKWNHKEMPKIF